VARKPVPSRARREVAVVDQVLDVPESSLLDLLDHVLNKGVMASGDVTLGVAGIDLIYLRLSALLCAADRVIPMNRQDERRRKRPAVRTGRRVR